MRTLSTRFRNLVEAFNSSDLTVCFATLTHEQLAVPITVNSDNVDYVYNGVTFYGLQFGYLYCSDDENVPPKSQAQVEDIDPVISRSVQALPSPPNVTIQIMVKSDFTDDDPRQPIGTPVVEFTLSGFKLRNVSSDGMFLTGDIVGTDFSSEPFPAARAKPEDLPGMFW